MKKVQIDLGQRAYQILIGPDLLAQTGVLVAGLTPGRKALVVTNPVVEQLYAGTVQDSLQRAGLEVTLAVLPDGEQTKTLAWAQEIYDLAFGAGLDRSCPVLALGGGVIGDLAGFVAATYMRGVPLVQIPTTLLAQVDSSVGGKVAVNHPRGKNIIGAFYQPRLVLADTATLSTLPGLEIRSGLAEVIKYGIIYDSHFFTWLEQNLDRVLNLDPAALIHVVAVSCRIKAAVVEEDEREQGRRAILNYGHTVGHAVETLTDYQKYRHGEAVAMGMAVAARLAVNLGQLDPGAAHKIEELLKRAGLPTRIPVRMESREILAAMARDKKAYHGRITFILPRSIGAVTTDDPGREAITCSLEQSRAIEPDPV